METKVTDAGYGSPIELITTGENSQELYRIIVNSGERYASMVGDLSLILSLNLEVGATVSGRIVVIDQFEPIIPDDPLVLTKMKNGKICRKDGKVIYRQMFLTYDPRIQDFIIEED